ncbi:tetraspanin-33 [Amyelois transitella]|uniref:tetraspanin-33 n=1 Tax=Amyelois transitella TaxID=680683 RepID=UPI0029902249|nr:tetraspanin-33 [Amyelois transitella]
MRFNKMGSAKVLYGCFNTIFFACGFFEVVCGFLLLCDTQRVLLSRLLASPEAGLDQPPFYFLALALLAAGLLMCATAALGCWATYLPGYFILTFYFLVVLSLLMCECAGGVLASIWPRCLGLQNAHGGAVGALQTYYALPDYEYFTAAVDLAQTELECCGMTSSRNYDMSAWQLRRLGPRGLSVPLSCCVQSHRSYLNPVPRNTTRCQEVTADPKFRHVPGCLDRLDEWYQQQYLIFMLGLFVTAVFKLGILLSTVFSCIRLKRRRQEIRSFVMKSIDNNTNENIYESKMAMHDEPITAKYIQPNNFYSPRVRNPRIFHSKPNEMV